MINGLYYTPEDPENVTWTLCLRYLQLRFLWRLEPLLLTCSCRQETRGRNFWFSRQIRHYKCYKCFQKCTFLLANASAVRICPVISVKEQTWPHNQCSVFRGGIRPRACLHMGWQSYTGMDPDVRTPRQLNLQSYSISQSPSITCPCACGCQPMEHQEPALHPTGIVGMTMANLPAAPWWWCGQIRDCGGSKVINPQTKASCNGIPSQTQVSNTQHAIAGLACERREEVDLINNTFPQSKDHIDLWRKRNSE